MSAAGVTDCTEDSRAEGPGMTRIRTDRDALDDKVNHIFAGKVVRKDLVRK